MARVYRSVCNEADILLYRITHLVEKQIRYKLEMERLMNKGFVKIAKARYIMGSTCVTKMQLPSENSNPIQPLATVCRAEKNNHWVFHIHRKDALNQAEKKKSIKKENEIDNKENEGSLSDDQNSHSSLLSEKLSLSEDDFKETLQKNPKALKKAKIAFHVDDTNYEECKEELLDEFSNRGSSESLYTLTDPMRLFGILVPNTLKSAQDKFKEVVALLGKCATLQSELQESLHRYNHLHRVKVLMENAAAEAKINILETRVYWTQPNYSMLSCKSDTKDEEEGEKISVTKSVISVFFDNGNSNDKDNANDNDDENDNGKTVDNDDSESKMTKVIIARSSL